MTTEELETKPPAGYGYIYKLTSPSGKAYIGQTTQTLAARFVRHCQPASHCPYLHSAIAKYGAATFVIELLGCHPTVELDPEEKKAVAAHGTLIPKGYNATDGGDRGRRGEPVSDETRQRMSEARKRRIALERDCKAAGLPVPQPVRPVHARSGWKLSAETRARMSATRKRLSLGFSPACYANAQAARKAKQLLRRQTAPVPAKSKRERAHDRLVYALATLVPPAIINAVCERGNGRIEHLFRSKVEPHVAHRPGVKPGCMSLAHKEALIKANTGRRWTLDRATRMRAVHLGRKQSPEARAKISAAAKIRMNTPEAKARIAASNRARAKHSPVQTVSR